jgi:hypothetical protein
MGLLTEYIRNKWDKKQTENRLLMQSYANVLRDSFEGKTENPEISGPWALKKLGVSDDELAGSLQPHFQRAGQRKKLTGLITGLLHHAKQQGQLPQAAAERQASPAAGFSPAPWSTRQAPAAAPPAAQEPQQKGKQKQPQAVQLGKRGLPEGLFLTHEQLEARANADAARQALAADKVQDMIRTKNFGEMMTAIQSLPEEEKPEAIRQAWDYRWGFKPTSETRKPVTFKLKDGTTFQGTIGGKSGQVQDWRGNLWIPPEGAQMVSTSQSSVPRVVGRISRTNVLQMAANGSQYPGEDGKPIDVSKLPQGTELVAVQVGMQPTFYIPASQNQTHFAVGGMMYAMPAMEQISAAGGEGVAASAVPLGPSQVPSESVRPVMAIDPRTGETIVQNLPAYHRPVISGMTPRVTGFTPSVTPQTPAPGAAPPARTPSRLGRTATPRAAGTPGSAAAAPAAGASAQPAQRGIGSPPPMRAITYQPSPGMAPGTYRAALDRITAVREADTQVFGDPSQPDMKPLASFAYLADRKESRERLGRALLLTFDEMRRATGESGITGAAGPLSVHAGGGVVDLLEKYFNVPAAIADQTNNIMQQAIQSLTKEEREAYDATISTFSTIVGLRSLTRASAAQASVAAIEREIPTIGLFTADSANFNDKLQHLGEVVFNGSKGIPKSMWDQTPGLYEHIQTLPSRMREQRQQGAGGGGRGGSSVVDDLVRQYGGRR